MARYCVLTVAVGGYERAFRANIDNHRAYAAAHGYDYHCLVGEHDPALQREVAWLKVPLLLGALAGGYAGVLFLDTDARFTETRPRFFRRGEVAAWAEELTPEDQATVEAACLPLMASFGYAPAPVA